MSVLHGGAPSELWSSPARSPSSRRRLASEEDDSHGAGLSKLSLNGTRLGGVEDNDGAEEEIVDMKHGESADRREIGGSEDDGEENEGEIYVNTMKSDSGVDYGARKERADLAAADFLILADLLKIKTMSKDGLFGWAAIRVELRSTHSGTVLASRGPVLRRGQVSSKSEDPEAADVSQSSIHEHPDGHWELKLQDVVDVQSFGGTACRFDLLTRGAAESTRAFLAANPETCQRWVNELRSHITTPSPVPKREEANKLASSPASKFSVMRQADSHSQKHLPSPETHTLRNDSSLADVRGLDHTWAGDSTLNGSSLTADAEITEQLLSKDNAFSPPHQHRSKESENLHGREGAVSVHGGRQHDLHSLHHYDEGNYESRGYREKENEDEDEDENEELANGTQELEEEPSRRNFQIDAHDDANHAANMGLTNHTIRHFSFDPMDSPGVHEERLSATFLMDNDHIDLHDLHQNHYDDSNAPQIQEKPVRRKKATVGAKVSKRTVKTQSTTTKSKLNNTSSTNAVRRKPAAPTVTKAKKTVVTLKSRPAPVDLNSSLHRPTRASIGQRYTSLKSSPVSNRRRRGSTLSPKRPSRRSAASTTSESVRVPSTRSTTTNTKKKASVKSSMSHSRSGRASSVPPPSRISRLAASSSTGVVAKSPKKAKLTKREQALKDKCQTQEVELARLRHQLQAMVEVPQGRAEQRIQDLQAQLESLSAERDAFERLYLQSGSKVEDLKVQVEILTSRLQQYQQYHGGRPADGLTRIARATNMGVGGMPSARTQWAKTPVDTHESDNRTSLDPRTSKSSVLIASKKKQATKASTQQGSHAASSPSSAKPRRP